MRMRVELRELVPAPQGTSRILIPLHALSVTSPVRLARVASTPTVYPVSHMRVELLGHVSVWLDITLTQIQAHALYVTVPALHVRVVVLIYARSVLREPN